jgi:hypothetical protein
MGGGLSTPFTALYPRERLGTQCIGGWVGPTASLDGCGKSFPPPGFDPQTVQSLVSCYTDWAIAAPLERNGAILAEAGVFSCFQIVQNGSCDSAYLLCNGYLGYLRALKKLGHEVENSLPYSEKVKVNGATPLFFLYTFMACTGGNFTLLSFYLI